MYKNSIGMNDIYMKPHKIKKNRRYHWKAAFEYFKIAYIIPLFGKIHKDYREK
jgi:hypothetical protein